MKNRRKTGKEKKGKRERRWRGESERKEGDRVRDLLEEREKDADK